MHPDLLYAYDAMLPRLQAQEQLLAIEAATAHRLQPADLRQRVAALRSQAEPGWRTRGAARPRSREAHEQAVASHGIGVRHVPRSAQGVRKDAGMREHA